MPPTHLVIVIFLFFFRKTFDIISYNSILYLQRICKIKRVFIIIRYTTILNANVIINQQFYSYITNITVFPHFFYLNWTIDFKIFHLLLNFIQQILNVFPVYTDCPRILNIQDPFNITKTTLFCTFFKTKFQIYSNKIS